MDEQHARRVAANWNRAYGRHNRTDTPEGRATWTAMHDALRWLVADDVDHHAITADAKPMIYALSSDAVFVVAPQDVRTGPPLTAHADVRRVPLVPAAAIIDVEAVIGDGRFGPGLVEMYWAFALGDETKINVRCAGDAAAETQFARALAERLGWKLPSVAEPLR